MTMTPVNPLNIYTGPTSLQDYYDPEKQPLLPLVEIPDGLNPFRGTLLCVYVATLQSRSYSRLALIEFVPYLEGVKCSAFMGVLL